jgi:hypothetical protein
MTLWARADVSYVHVGEGGCGSPHSRPVTNGKPAEHFVLNCQPCENVLRSDIARSGGNKKVRTVNGDYGMKLADRYLGLWGATKETIPETPDEELAREHDEQAMITKNAASQTQTLAQIGAAVAGNAELMAKFIELQTQLASQQHPVMVMPEQPITQGELPSAEAPAPGWNQRTCVDCGQPIVRAEGQRGALPSRCPACKATYQASQRRTKAA